MSVYTARHARRGTPKRYHTDRECPYLNQAADIRERDSAPGGYVKCAWCRGERSHHDGGSKDHLRALKAAAKE